MFALSVPDEGYYRNSSCALSFYINQTKLKNPTNILSPYTFVYAYWSITVVRRFPKSTKIRLYENIMFSQTTKIGICECKLIHSIVFLLQNSHFFSEFCTTKAR